MLIGSYILEKEIGRGAMSEVWSGRPVASDERVAVKVITGGSRRRDTTRETFFREVRTVASLNHPGIIRILDYGEGDFEPAGGTVPYLVTELAAGGTLGSGWQAGNFADVRRTLVAMLDALAHAHARGVVHRDLKPGNVLRVSRKPDADVKVADFGIARLVPLGERTAGDEFIAGTPPYMAPEQIRGDWRDQGPWTDLYSVGCIAWKMVTGTAPFEGSRHEVLRMHLAAELPTFLPRIGVPDEFEAWLLWLLQRGIPDRCQRAADAAMQLLALENVLEPITLEFSTGGEVAIPSTLILDTGESVDLAAEVADPGGDELVARLRRIASPQRAIVNSPLHTELRLWGLRRLPFVGREAERTRVWSILQSTFDSPKPQLTILRGAPGTGKSALARWLVERSHELGLAEPLMIVHDPIVRMDDGLPGALVRWFRLENLNPGEVVTRLRARIRRHLDDEQAAIALAGVLTDWIGSRTNISPRGFEGRERAAGVLAVLRILTRDRAGVVWIEDGHRARQTFEYLRGAIEHAGSDCPRLMIIVTDQDAEPGDSSSLARAVEGLADIATVHEIQLEPLDEAATVRLLEATLPLEPSFAAALAARADGNPLFAIQMLGDWISRSELMLDEQGRLAVQDLEVALPRSLRGVLLRKLDGVARELGVEPSAVLQTLELAAAFGQTVRRIEWSVARDKASLPGTGANIDLLIRSGIAVPVGEDWAFSHDLFRDVLVRSARESARWREWNRVCVETLTDVYPDPDPERCAVHYLEAEMWQMAVTPCLDASRSHFGARSLDTAREWVARAQDAMARGALASDDPRVGQGLVAQFKVAQAGAEYELAARLLDDLEDSARRHGWNELLVSAMTRRSGLRLVQGDPRGALDAALRAEGAATAVGDDLGRFLALGHAANAAIELGRWNDAERWSQSRLAIADAFGPDVAPHIAAGCRAHARFRLGAVLAQRSGLDKAETLLEELDATVPGDDKILQALAHSLRGDLAWFRDDPDAARTGYEQSVALFQKWSFRGDEAVLVRLGVLDLLAGDLGAARRHFELARTSVERQRTDSDRTLVRLACCVVDALEGGWEEVGFTLEGPGVFTREGGALYLWLQERASSEGQTAVAEAAASRHAAVHRALAHG